MFSVPTELLAKVQITEATTAVTLEVNALKIAALDYTPRHLLVRFNAMHDSAADQTVLMDFNGDTGDNYSQLQHRGKGTAKTATQFVSRANIPLVDISNVANIWGGGEVLMPDALSTRSHKACVGQLGTAEGFVVTLGGRWADTAAITSVTFRVAANFAVGSIFELCVVDESYIATEMLLTEAGTFGNFGNSGANWNASSDNGDIVLISNLRGAGSLHNDHYGLYIYSGNSESNYRLTRLGAAKTTSFSTNQNDGSLSSDTGYNAYQAHWHSPMVIPADSATAGVFGGGVQHMASFSDTVGAKSLFGLTAETTLTNSNDMITVLGSTTDASRTRALDFWAQSAVGSYMSVQGTALNNKDLVSGSMLSAYYIPSSGGNTIQRQELTEATTTVTFSSIPQTYDHLELVVYARSDASAATATVNMSFNSDTTAANYDYQLLQGEGETVTAATSASGLGRGLYPAANAEADTFGTGTTTIYNYTKTDRHNHSITTMGSSEHVENYSHRWENTAAITQMVLTMSSGDFITGSTLELRGINAPAAAATDIETINGIATTNIQAVN